MHPPPYTGSTFKELAKNGGQLIFSALEQTSWFDINEDMLHLDTALNYEVLTEYYKTTKDGSLDADFENHAYKYWNQTQDLQVIDSSSFY